MVSRNVFEKQTEFFEKGFFFQKRFGKIVHTHKKEYTMDFESDFIKEFFETKIEKDLEKFLKRLVVVVAACW